jgi:aspartate racemase
MLVHQVPILHIGEATIGLMRRGGFGGDCVGLIGTGATLTSGFFAAMLGREGWRCVVSTDGEQQTLVAPAIRLVKANRLEESAPLLRDAILRLLDRGAERVILACTELPVLLTRVEGLWPLELAGKGVTVRDLCVDPTRALAAACVEWWARTQLQQGTDHDLASCPRKTCAQCSV